MNLAQRILKPIENAIVLTVTVVATVGILGGGVFGTTVIADKIRKVPTGSSWKSTWNFVNNNSQGILNVAASVFAASAANKSA